MEIKQNIQYYKELGGAPARSAYHKLVSVYYRVKYTLDIIYYKDEPSDTESPSHPRGGGGREATLFLIEGEWR